MCGVRKSPRMRHNSWNIWIKFVSKNVYTTPSLITAKVRRKHPRAARNPSESAYRFIWCTVMSKWTQTNTLCHILTTRQSTLIVKHPGSVTSDAEVSLVSQVSAEANRAGDGSATTDANSYRLTKELLTVECTMVACLCCDELRRKWNWPCGYSWLQPSAKHSLENHRTT